MQIVSANAGCATVARTAVVMPMTVIRRTRLDERRRNMSDLLGGAVTQANDRGTFGLNEPYWGNRDDVDVIVSDTALVERAQRRDPDAFRLLYERHAPAVSRVCRSWL